LQDVRKLEKLIFEKRAEENQVQSNHHHHSDLQLHGEATYRQFQMRLFIHML